MARVRYMIYKWLLKTQWALSVLHPFTISGSYNSDFLSKMPPGLSSKENGIIGAYWKSPSFKFIPKDNLLDCLETLEIWDWFKFCLVGPSWPLWYVKNLTWLVVLAMNRSWCSNDFFVLLFELVQVLGNVISAELWPQLLLRKKKN